ncbi:MAG: glycosyltransferase family 4 protein, partial [Chloroflexi bacterium]
MQILLCCMTTMLSFRTYSKDLSTRWIYLRVWLCVKLNLRSILHNGQRRLLVSIMPWMARKFILYLLEQILKLEELGIQAELTVCGCIPPDRFSHERMSVIPFLNRGDEAQRRQLENLFETSDFLFLPTRGETYGMVFCEASSFGLPSITTNTGGVSGAV